MFDKQANWKRGFECGKGQQGPWQQAVHLWSAAMLPCQGTVPWQMLFIALCLLVCVQGRVFGSVKFNTWSVDNVDVLNLFVCRAQSTLQCQIEQLECKTR